MHEEVVRRMAEKISEGSDAEVKAAERFELLVRLVEEYDHFSQEDHCAYCGKDTTFGSHDDDCAWLAAKRYLEGGPCASA